jgi:hypothetical protein
MRLQATESDGTRSTIHAIPPAACPAESPACTPTITCANDATRNANNCHHQYSERDARVRNLSVCDSTDDTAARNGTTER